MKVYHVCGPSKLALYQDSRVIKGPVRAWTDIFEAVRFSISTGRPIILRLCFPDDAPRLPGHGGNAVCLDEDFPLPESLYVGKSDEIANPIHFLRVRADDPMKAGTLSLPLSKFGSIWHDDFGRVYFVVGGVKSMIARCPSTEICLSLENAVLHELSVFSRSKKEVLDVEKIAASKLAAILHSEVPNACCIGERSDA